MLQQILTYAQRKSPSLTRNRSGAKVDVAANREKPKNPRIPARTYEGCNHREQKQMRVLRSREERAQTRPHRRRAMQGCDQRATKQTFPRRADGNGAPTTNQPPAGMVYTCRGQDLLLYGENRGGAAAIWPAIWRSSGRDLGEERNG
jgi:hypothetical protein